MSGEMAVSLALKFTDQASGPATQAMQKITRATKEVGTAAQTASTAAISAFQKLANARETLGVRSEKTIQNEIRQTEAAYKRLAASGQASARELARAQDAVRDRVSKLRQEINGVNTASARAGGALRTAFSLAGAGVAGKMVLQGPVSQTMDYSMQMAHAANTIFSGRSVAERIAGKSQINEAVMAGVRQARGGVTREDSLAGVKTLAASGEYGNDPGAVFAMLPTLTKAAAANNASVTDMANIAIKAKSTMGLTNTGRILDMAAQGGIEGQFELRDMAKWLPQQMAYAKRSGLSGEQGFASLVAANQLSMTTAGSADEAGSNLKNLLSKVNSTDTAADAKKMGIDLSGSLAAAQSKGVGGLDAFLNLSEKVAAQDPRLVKLREQAKGAKGDDLRSNMQSQIDILEGSSIGKLVQDQQAMGALVALLNNRGKFDEIRDKTLAANGTNEDLLSVIGSESGAKAQLAAAEAANNMQTALDRVNPLIGSAADGFSALSQQFPVMTAALTGSALGVGALGAAAIAAAGSLTLLGGGGAAAGIAAGAGKLATAAGGLSLPALGVAAAGAAGYGVGYLANDVFLKDTAAGNAIGSGVNSVMALFGNEQAKANQVNHARPDASGPIVIENKVILDGREISATVNEHNARTAARN